VVWKKLDYFNLISQAEKLAAFTNFMTENESEPAVSGHPELGKWLAE